MEERGTIMLKGGMQGRDETKGEEDWGRREEEGRKKREGGREDKVWRRAISF